MVKQLNFDAAVADMRNDIGLRGPTLVARQVTTLLEENGFLRSVAGEEDFDTAVKGVCLCSLYLRGILVTGRNGCGKTQFLKAFYGLKKSPWKVWIDCNNPESLQGLSDPCFYDMSVFVDDIGAEYMSYGDNDVLGRFIAQWHARHKPGRYFFGSTNLTSAKLDERYGGRVFDRVKEMCVIVPFEGESKRQPIVAK